MEAFFKDDYSILSLLHQMIREAEKRQRFIDRIELTPPEWDMFVRELEWRCCYPSTDGIRIDGAKEAIFRGVRIVKKAGGS